MNKTKKIIIAVVSVILILTIGGFLIKNQTTNNPEQPAKQENQLTDESKKVTEVASFFEKELIWKKENNPDFEKGKEIKFKEDLELQQGTIEMWLKPKISNTGKYQKIITSSNNSIELGFQPDGDLYFYPAQAGTQNYNLIKKPIDNNELTHIAITWDYKTKKVQFYINGQKQKNDIENIPTNWKQNLQLGKSWYILGETSGSIQDLKIHSNILSDKDIRLKYTKNALKKNVLDYTVKDSVIFYNGRKLDDADYESFEYLGGDYAKDKNNVYYENEILKNADPKTFVYLEYPYSKDKNNVYCWGRKIENADPKTFEHLGGNNDDNYAKDKNNVYRYNEILKDVDLKTFEYVGDDYSKDKNDVYFNNKIIENADSKTFVYLRYRYAKDKNYVYYQDKILKNKDLKVDLDPKTFEYLGDRYSKDKNNVYYYTYDIFSMKDADLNSFKYLGGSYAKDKNYVYYDGKIIKNAKIDVTTFRFIEDDCAKDKNNVYYRGRVVDITNPQTFEYIEDDYFKDKINVYFRDDNKFIIIKGADPKTFEYIKDGYAKDKNNVYNQEVILKNIDVKSFEIVNHDYYIGYVKDKNNVYYNNRKIENADSKTFVYLGYFYAKDKNNVYQYGKIFKNADSKTFEYLTDRYVKDKNNVYYENKKIKGADSKTFVFLNDGYSKDKNNVYYRNKILKNAEPKTFKALENYEGYGVDEKNAYCDGKKIEGADSKTFQLVENKKIGDFFAKDSKGLYYCHYGNFGKVSNVNINTLKLEKNKYDNLVLNDNNFEKNLDINKLDFLDNKNFNFDGNIEEWKKDKPTFVLDKKTLNARAGKVWVKYNNDGVYFAGEVEGKKAKWAKSMREMSNSDHIEIWVSGKESPKFGGIGNGNQFGFEDYEDISDCGDNENCKKWYKEQKKYRYFLKKAFVKQWQISPVVSGEVYAKKAYKDLKYITNKVNNEYEFLYDNINERDILKPNETFKPTIKIVDQKNSKDAYTFEIFIPFEAFPPQYAKDFGKFRFLLDIFNSRKPNQKVDFSSTSKQRKYGKTETYNIIETPKVKKYYVTKCEDDIKNYDFYFLPIKNDLDHLNSFVFYTSGHGYNDGWEYLSPEIHLIDELRTRKVFESEFVCSGGGISYRKDNKKIKGKLFFNKDSLVKKVHNGVMIYTENQYTRSMFGAGQGGGTGNYDEIVDFIDLKKGVVKNLIEDIGNDAEMMARYYCGENSDYADIDFEHNNNWSEVKIVRKCFDNSLKKDVKKEDVYKWNSKTRSFDLVKKAEKKVKDVDD